MLHHLSFEIHPGEKVGVLGRTGSGKSTLALSFFRFVEPTEGRILIDGLDVSKIGLTDLRSKLTIIPRECDPSSLRCVSLMSCATYRGPYHTEWHAAVDPGRLR